VRIKASRDTYRLQRTVIGSRRSPGPPLTTRSMICWPIVTMIYGRQYWLSGAMIRGPADVLISWVLPAIAVVLFSVYQPATPGKIAIGARIVDAETGEQPSTGQLIGRYLGCYVSIIPLSLGIIWVAFDPWKQGWHAKLAGTGKARVPGDPAVRDRQGLPMRIVGELKNPQAGRTAALRRIIRTDGTKIRSDGRRLSLRSRAAGAAPRSLLSGRANGREGDAGCAGSRDH